MEEAYHPNVTREELIELEIEDFWKHIPDYTEERANRFRKESQYLYAMIDLAFKDIIKNDFNYSEWCLHGFQDSTGNNAA